MTDDDGDEGKVVAAELADVEETPTAENLEKCDDCGKVAVKEIEMDMIECRDCHSNYPAEDEGEVCANCGCKEFQPVKGHRFRECQSCGECRPTNVEGGCQCGCQEKEPPEITPEDVEDLATIQQVYECPQCGAQFVELPDYGTCPFGTCHGVDVQVLEIEKLNQYRDLLKDGMSEAEAQGTVWGQPLVQPSESSPHKPLEYSLDLRIYVREFLKRTGATDILGGTNCSLGVQFFREKHDILLVPHNVMAPLKALMDEGLEPGAKMLAFTKVEVAKLIDYKLE
jgi:ribosomal protein L37AE/L43A